ncbi:MAG: hypothetical protein CL762_00775 [Chloroflexi bacterium]|mgnify:CR=1 FL=1|nr:hypothetical protein [Chloroflexota bacterium]|tara:strand:- start:14800 stop:15543 length:744 start_codon:yes stop_codon:yes gene_type:complete
MNLIAHRGFSSKSPENTFASFDMAIENGFNIIELDVQLTKDKIPVIIHDYKVDRTTDGQGMVNEIKYTDIIKLDGGSWFDKSFNKERIPTLEKVLDKYIENAHLQIELKSDDLDLTEVVIDLIRSKGWIKNLNDNPYAVPGFSITSFNLRHVINTIRLVPDFRVGWLLNNIKKNEIFENLSKYKIGMIIPNVHDDLWNDKDFLNTLLDKKITVCAWGTKTIEDVKKMKSLGVNAITVDWPDVAKRII